MELLFFKKPNTCDFTATPFRTGPAQENTFYKFSRIVSSREKNQTAKLPRATNATPTA
jgi:hypothetical protein